MSLTNNAYTPFPPKVLFIDSNYVKSICPCPVNIDETFMTPAIVTAMHKYILPPMGSGFYGDMQNQIQVGAISGNTGYTYALQNFIMPTLAWYAMVELAPYISVQLTNKGYINKNTEFGTYASTAQVNMLITNYKDTANFFVQRLINFLRENEVIYPLYINPGPGVDVMQPNSTNYFSQVHIPQRSGGNGNINPKGWGISLVNPDVLRNLL